jgi:uncharacterized coiled-coil DUF342 family protein
LSFAKRLTEAGDMALKEFVMETVATKADIQGLRAEIQGLRGEIKDVRGEIVSFRKEAEERFATKDELRHEIGLLRKDVDAMGLKLTVRMGGMLVVAVGAMATVVKVL